MPGSIGPKPKSLLSVTGVVEAATGFALLAAPSMLVELLLGAEAGTSSGLTVSRVAGVAILALGVACWLARDDATSRAANGLVAAMLLYNVAVAAVLVLAWMRLGLFGIALWPVALAHAGLAAWCVTCLSKRTPDAKRY